MGNNSSANNQQTFLEDLGSKYQEIKKDSRGMVLLHKQSDITYLLRQFVYPTETTFKNKLKSIQEQIAQPPREFIINPIKVQQQVFNNFCSTSYKIYVVYQYPQVTLRQEIIARKKQNKNFQETQLWSILQSCTNALGQLKPYISLNPNEIFINPDGNLKIIHDDLIQQNYRVLITNNVYYAPQKLKSFNKQDSELSMRKQSIFSMGMTILQAAQLQQISSCYNYNEGSFDQNQLELMLASLQDKYSPQFIDILNNILEVNPNRRASLMEIQNNLDQYWNLQKGETEQIQTKNSKINYQNNEQKQMNQEVLRQKMNDPTKNSRLHNKPYEIQNHKELTFNNSKKYISYDPSAIETPKNVPLSKENNASLYTDPKLFEMIRKDLQEINKLKQSALYETSRYTFMYPQTQNILNSIKNMNRQPINTNKTLNNPFQHVRKERMSFQQENKMPQLKQYKTNEYGQEYKMKQPRKSQNYNPRIQNVEEINYTSKNMKKQHKQNLVYIIQTYQNGSRYEGTTLNGLKHGYGKLIFQDGVYYQGEFKEDKMNGKGVLYYSMSQIAYDGQWSNDQFNGYGILYNENPAALNVTYDYSDFNNIDDFWIKYQGNFVFDNKSGEGKLFLTNGQILHGQFKEDYVDGHCRFMKVNGQTIQGFWQTNILNQQINDEN